MSTMSPDLLPIPPSESHATRRPRHWLSLLRPNGALKIGFFSTPFLLTGLIVYVAFFSPYYASWHRHLATLLPKPTSLSSSPPAPASDVLTLEQIRDIVAPTRGFFSRDYSMRLGWNNMRYIIEAALLQAELLNRTLVIPSFLYTRACEYNISVCADHATMVNKGDAMKTDEWFGMPIEQQMGFRIPISVIVNMTHLRNRQPVITTSEYLRLHGQDPKRESSTGYWFRKKYHARPNVFETNKTKKPSLFVIKNRWYNPTNTTRVDYIPEAMKRRGKLERHHGPDNYDSSTEYWPHLEPTQLSVFIRWRGSVMDWSTAMSVLEEKSDLVGDVNLGDDEAVEELLNAHGWEVLHTFENAIGMDPAKTIVSHFKQVAQRSSIRGFRDDYHDVDADVVVLSGQTHLGTGPGAMLFTEELGRSRFASTVLHSLVPPQKVFDLAEVLSSRMRLRTEGRMWMGAHMRRGDFVGFGWAMEMEPEDHIRRVKEHLDAGRSVLVDLHDRGDWTTFDIEGTQPDPEQVTLPPPQAGDPFFVATDERDPDARRKIAAAGAVFVSDLLTVEDRRAAFDWPLMITDVLALVEQQLLVRAGFFYGHGLSSFSGAILNMRAARGVDPRTTLLD